MRPWPLVGFGQVSRFLHMADLAFHKTSSSRCSTRLLDLDLVLTVRIPSPVLALAQLFQRCEVEHAGTTTVACSSVWVPRAVLIVRLPEFRPNKTPNNMAMACGCGSSLWLLGAGFFVCTDRRSNCTTFVGEVRVLFRFARERKT